jgi:hypothetical protein
MCRERKMRLRDRAACRSLIAFLEPRGRAACWRFVGFLYTFLVIWAVFIGAIVDRTVPPFMLDTLTLYKEGRQVTAKFAQVFRGVLENIAVRYPSVKDDTSRWVARQTHTTRPWPGVLLDKFLDDFVFDKNLLAEHCSFGWDDIGASCRPWSAALPIFNVRESIAIRDWAHRGDAAYTIFQRVGLRRSRILDWHLQFKQNAAWKIKWSHLWLWREGNKGSLYGIKSLFANVSGSMRRLCGFLQFRILPNDFPELATHHTELAVVNAQSEDSNNGEDYIGSDHPLFGGSKLPRKLIGFILCSIGLPFAVVGQCAFQWSGWHHWRLARRLVLGIGGWAVAVVFICHGAGLLLGIN